MTSNLAILVPFISALFIQPLCAQDVDSVIGRFNELTSGEYVISNKGKILIVDGFREGNKVKENRVNVFELDLESVKYSKIDNSVSVKCFEDMDGCVVSVLTQERKKKTYRNRLVFAVDGIDEGAEVSEGLMELLKTMSKKY